MSSNDLFANRQAIADGADIHSDTTGAGTEPDEDGLLSCTVWYEWIADTTQAATVTIAGTVWDWIGVAVWVQSDAAVDTLATITLVGRSNTGGHGGGIGFIAQAGLTYYFQVGSWTPGGHYNFTLTYPPGRTPGTAESGVDDLPRLSGVVPAALTCEVIEAVGYGPESEQITTALTLLGSDNHSISNFLTPLLRNADGSHSYSYERWFRLRFTPPFAVVTNVRMWFDNYQPLDGWSLHYGTVDSYEWPVTVESAVATQPIPTVDPVQGNLDTSILTGVEIRYTPWIVLQAAWLPATSTVIQPVFPADADNLFPDDDTFPIEDVFPTKNLIAHFAWTEC